MRCTRTISLSWRERSLEGRWLGWLAELWASTLWEKFCSALLNSLFCSPLTLEPLTNLSFIALVSGDFEGYNPIPSTYTYWQSYYTLSPRKMFCVIPSLLAVIIWGNPWCSCKMGRKSSIGIRSLGVQVKQPQMTKFPQFPCSQTFLFLCEWRLQCSWSHSQVPWSCCLAQGSMELSYCDHDAH